MKLKNILIVVKDIEKSKKFYHEIFGLDVLLDNEGNLILTEGLVLQDEKVWKNFLGKDIMIMKMGLWLWRNIKMVKLCKLVVLSQVG